MSTKRHKWTFTSRFRVRTFGWRSSGLACKRLREAVSEIKKVARKDPVLGAQGAVKLMEKIWPALEHVDSSSGAQGSAVAKAVDALVQIVIDAPATQKTRARWLDRLWQAHEDDGVEYLGRLGERWGEICGSVEVASQWADRLLPVVKRVWADDRGAYFQGSSACLSCLLVTGRHQEMLEMLEMERTPFWHHRKYGVEALLAQGKKQEALQYAEVCRTPYSNEWELDRACEDILLSSGLEEEAYRRYGLSNRAGTSFLSWFRAVAKRYPGRDKEQILRDLVEATPCEEGKWFATAKELGLYALALELASRSPCDPRTLNRAARDHIQSNARFALGAAIKSIAWMAEGYGYEVTSDDVHDAYKHALDAAAKLDLVEQVLRDLRKIADRDNEPARWVNRALARRLELEP